MVQEAWRNDLYERLAQAPAQQSNSIAAGMLETLLDHRWNDLRSIMLDESHVYPDSHVLELGCGPGMLLEQLVERVGEEGRVVGLDINPHLISIAQQRTRDLAYSNATFVTADCHELPFESRTFDAVIAEKLLLHVAPISRIISEAARVLDIGGRLVLADYDPYACFAAGPDPRITARVLASAATQYASPLAAREAARACAAAGLYVERIRGHLLLLDDPKAPTASGVASVWADHAIMGREVDPMTARRWLAAVDRTMKNHSFLIGIPHIVTVARRVK